MNKALLFHFVRQDLIEKHASSALGALWTLLLPLANILIFTLVFSRLMGAKLQLLGMSYLGEYSYSIYLIVGLLLWNCFASTLTRICQVFHDKAGLITKVNVSLLWLPVYIVISEAFIYGVSMAFFAVFLCLVGFDWQSQWLWLPLLLVITQLLAYALGLICAVLNVFLRDISTATGVIMQLWFWLTPIVYVPNILPEGWAVLLAYNPLSVLVSLFRDTLIMGQLPNFTHLFIMATLAVSLLLVALFLGTRLEKDIRDFL